MQVMTQAVIAKDRPFGKFEWGCEGGDLACLMLQ